MPISDADWRRIEQTVAARDTESIPKVPGAGEVTSLDGELVQRMHNGLLVTADGYYGEWMTELIRRLRGHHEPQEELAFHTIVSKLAADTTAPVILELGSFWAYYSMWAKQRCPAARLVLVEPDVAHIQVGCRNLELNGMVAEVVHAAVGARHGISEPLVWETDERPHDTRRVTVDGLADELGLETIDLLLCDVQGAELTALEGARRMLDQGRLRFLLVSTHHHSISGDPLTHQRCLRLLRETGAHVIAEHSVAESCSGDGLIAVSMQTRDEQLSAPVSHSRARDSLFGELEWDLARALGHVEIPAPPWP